MSEPTTVTMSIEDFKKIQLALICGLIWIQEAKDQNRILKDDQTSKSLIAAEKEMEKLCNGEVSKLYASQR